MYRWYIKLLLNNGATIKGVYYTKENESSKVISDLFVGDFHCFQIISESVKNKDVTILGFNRNDVSAFWVSTEPFDEGE